ncbi:hypothetical protein Trydic_g5738, partial [Trypoxylus dichotomus]
MMTRVLATLKKRRCELLLTVAISVLLVVWCCIYLTMNQQQVDKDQIIIESNYVRYILHHFFIIYSLYI